MVTQRTMFSLWISLLMVVMSGMTWAQESDLLIQTDFQTCDYSTWVTIPSQSSQGVVQGNFPQDWVDNSSWSAISYTSMQVNDGTDTFWRITAPVTETGWVQLLHYLPSQMGGTSKHYKLIVVARGDQSINPRIRQIGSPYQSLWEVNQSLTSTWQTYQWEFDIRQTSTDEVGFWINMPSSPCQVDIQSIQLLENDQPIFQTDFQTCNYGSWVTIPSQSTQGIVHGNFPENWADNSSWGSISYTSMQTVEGSENFWRVSAPLAESGWIQLRHSLLPQLGGELYRYVVTLEARGDQPISLGIRQNGAPYQFSWQVDQPLTSTWQTYQWEFIVRQTVPNEVGFWINIPSTPCQVDFKNIQFQRIDQVIMETDFQTCNYGSWLTLPSQSTQGIIQGNFPSDWIDNSSWASVVYESQQGQEGTDTFWNISAPVAESGSIQLMHGLPSVLGGQTYRYALKFKARGDQKINLGIRQYGAPYQYLWQGSKSLGTEWQAFEWEFTLPQTQPGEVGFWLNVQGSPAQMDFKEIQLLEIRPDLVEANSYFLYAGNGPVNLLRQSRLPLGLPNGWSLFREFDDLDDVTITSIPDASSPSGSDVLSIDSPDKRISLYGEPMRIDRTWLTHTASLYVKGDGQLTMSVHNGFTYLGQTAMTLNNQSNWTRHDITFTPTDSDDATYLKFSGQGTFAIDGLMVHSGSSMQPYQSQLAAEVALGPGPGEIAEYTRCHFDDETATVNYVVTGVPAGTDAVLKLKMINVYGEELDLQPISLSGYTQYQGSVNYNVFADHPYGAIRIEAYVEDTQGQVISSFNELVMHRLRRPHYWLTDAPDSPFGVHTLATRRHVQMAKAVGANWTRLHDAGTEYIGWYHLENQQGQWQFRDTEIQRYRQYGMKIFGALSTAPTWASYYPGFYANSYFDRYYMPTDFNQFANDYVKVVVARYANVIDAWDIWNEPWGTWWSVDYDTVTQQYIPPANEVQTFANFQSIVYQAVKDANPSAKVAGFNTHFFYGGENWTQGMIQNGATPYADAFAYHHYTSSNLGYPGDIVKTKMQQHVNLFPGQQLPYGAWMTEGSPTAELIGSGFYNYTLPRPSSESVILTSDRLGRYCLSLLTAGVEKFFLYSMGNNRYFDQCNGHQVLMTEEGYLHPSADALSALAFFLEDTTYVSYQQMIPGVHAYHFTGTSNNVTVLVTSPGPRADYYLPNDPMVEYFDLFGNPLASGILMGDTLVFKVTSN